MISFCGLISKGSLAECLVSMDAGSTDRLAQQNLQIPEHTDNRTLASWPFDAHLSFRDRQTSRRPDAFLVTPILKSKPLSTPHLHQVQHARSHGELRKAHSLWAYKREYCENTRPGHQLEACSKQHETLCWRLKAKKVTLHTILLGVGGLSYNSNTLHHLKELGLVSQRIHKIALRLHAHKLTNTHLKKQNAFKALVWCRGLPATLQIPTSYLFHLLRRPTAHWAIVSPFP